MEPKTSATPSLADTFRAFFVDTGAIPETPKHTEFLAEKVEPGQQGDPVDRSEWAARTRRDGAE